MATVRITGNVHGPHKREWAGAPTVDEHGHIERSIKLPEEVYRKIEKGIAEGYREGILFIEGERRFDWLLD
jgi:hypothetical protein